MNIIAFVLWETIYNYNHAYCKWFWNEQLYRIWLLGAMLQICLTAVECKLQRNKKMPIGLIIFTHTCICIYIYVISHPVYIYFPMSWITFLLWRFNLHIIDFKFQWILSIVTSNCNIKWMACMEAYPRVGVFKTELFGDKTTCAMCKLYYYIR